jgi:hypothetical protein
MTHLRQYGEYALQLLSSLVLVALSKSIPCHHKSRTLVCVRILDVPKQLARLDLCVCYFEARVKSRRERCMTSTKGEYMNQRMFFALKTGNAYPFKVCPPVVFCASPSKTSNTLTFLSDEQVASRLP